MTNSTDLRISAMRAFFGRIYPEIRLIKALRHENRIDVYVIMSAAPSDRLREAVSEAMSEIIADVSDVNSIKDHLVMVTGPLPNEDCVAEGWIYRSAES